MSVLQHQDIAYTDKTRNRVVIADAIGIRLGLDSRYEEIIIKLDAQ